MKKVCIVVPAYKKNFTPLEMISLNRLSFILEKYPKVFIIPSSLKNDFQDNKFGFDSVCFPDAYFSDIFAYNRLCLSQYLYNKFLGYEYILIYQTDAMVFEDRLLEFCSMGFDYIGASWEDWNEYYVCGKIHHSYVGNGGFSLRKTSSCLRMVIKYEDIVNKWNLQEDLFFAYCGDYLDSEFVVAPREVAWKFSAETFPKYIYRLNENHLPFGCHAWNKADKLFYMDYFQKIGVDVQSYEKLFSSFLIGDNIKNDFVGAMGTLLYRESYDDILKFQHGQFSLICIDDYGIDLARKMLESGTDIYRVYLYDVTNHIIDGKEAIKLQTINLPRSKPKSMYLILGRDDESFIEILETHGYAYGIDFISLRREYRKFIMKRKDIYKQVSIQFPFSLFPKCSHVLIYSAGQREINYYIQAIQSEDISVVGIVDPDAGKKFFSGLNVLKVSEVQKIPFDYILIAINYFDYAIESKNALIQLGVDPQKIKWGIQFISKRGYILFGCGRSAKSIIKELRKFGIGFLYAVDKNTHGSTIDGLEIKSPDVLNPITVKEYIVISSALYEGEISNELIGLGFRPNQDFCLYDDLVYALWSL